MQSQKVTFEDLEICVDINKDAFVIGESNDAELVQEAKRMRFTKEGNNDDDDDSEDGIPSDLELLKAVKAIKKFPQFKNFKNEVLALGNIEKEVYRSIVSNKKQTSIKKYFS